MYLLLNLPVRCPRSGTRNTTLETHTCKSPLLSLGCKNCRRCLCLHLKRRETPGAPRPIKTLFVRIVASDWLMYDSLEERLGVIF